MESLTPQWCISWHLLWRLVVCCYGLPTLLSLGVGPDVLVGVELERSLELVVGLLGVLKAGGAYLPLDQEQGFLPDYLPADVHVLLFPDLSAILHPSSS